MVFAGFIGVQRGVSKEVEDSRMPPALWAGHISGMACPHSVEG
jgi:hypothetical protein